MKIQDRGSPGPGNRPKQHSMYNSGVEPEICSTCHRDLQPGNRYRCKGQLYDRAFFSIEFERHLRSFRYPIAQLKHGIYTAVILETTGYYIIDGPGSVSFHGKTGSPEPDRSRNRKGINQFQKSIKVAFEFVFSQRCKLNMIVSMVTNFMAFAENSEHKIRMTLNYPTQKEESSLCFMVIEDAQDPVQDTIYPAVYLVPLVVGIPFSSRIRLKPFLNIERNSNFRTRIPDAGNLPAQPLESLNILLRWESVHRGILRWIWNELIVVLVEKIKGFCYYIGGKMLCSIEELMKSSVVY